MSTDAVRLPEPGISATQNSHKASDELKGGASARPAELFQRAEQRTTPREGSLSSRPFLFTSPNAWTALDFAVALGAGILALSGAALLRSPGTSAGSAAWHALPFAFLFPIFGRLSGLYRLETHPSTVLQLVRIARAAGAAAVTLYGLQKIWGVTEMPGGTLLRVAAVAGTTMFAGRMLWRKRREALYERDIALRNFLIVGADEVGRDVRNYLSSLKHGGYRFKGFISLSEPTDNAQAVSEDELVGEIQDVIEVARTQFIDEIVFSRRPATPGVLSRVLRQAQALGIAIRLIPSVTETLVDRTDVEYIGELPTISVFQPKQSLGPLFLKRTFDLVVATTASIVLLPLFALIALAIKLHSPGPVLYLSKRVGHKARLFTCYKFRTMVKDADHLRDQLVHMNERHGILFKITHDPRITPLGRFLRKYSLDELPQLWNVIKGDMSLVGPRPSLGSEVAQYGSHHLRRLDAVPGITGLWQVEARQDPSFDSYVSLDSAYVNHWSLLMDVKILLRTVSAVVRGTGS